jgi:hypothetical protein
VLILLYLLSTALSGELDDAEAARLRAEISTHASRAQWDGVERNLEALVATGSSLDPGSLLSGASAAEARGDLNLCSDRLAAAAAAGGDPEMIDGWLTRLRDGYGRVVIVGEGLIPRTQPFAPIDRAVVARADAALSETGRFEGLLPPGRYLVGGAWLDVVAGEQVELDTTLKRRRSLGEILGLK